MDEEVIKALNRADNQINALRVEREERTRIAEHDAALRHAVAVNLKELIKPSDFQGCYKRLCGEAFYNLVVDDILANVPEGSNIMHVDGQIIFMQSTKEEDSFIKKFSKTFLKGYKPPTFPEVVENIINEKTNWGALLV
jgi:hypothetical protein